MHSVPKADTPLVSVNLPAGNKIKYGGSGIMDRSNSKSSNIQSNLHNIQLKFLFFLLRIENNLYIF